MIKCPRCDKPLSIIVKGAWEFDAKVGVSQPREFFPEADILTHTDFTDASSCSKNDSRLMDGWLESWFRGTYEVKDLDDGGIEIIERR